MSHNLISTVFKTWFEEQCHVYDIDYLVGGLKLIKLVLIYSDPLRYRYRHRTGSNNMLWKQLNLQITRPNTGQEYIPKKMPNLVVCYKYSHFAKWVNLESNCDRFSLSWGCVVAIYMSCNFIRLYFQPALPQSPMPYSWRSGPCFQIGFYPKQNLRTKPIMEQTHVRPAVGSGTTSRPAQFLRRN